MTAPPEWLTELIRSEQRRLHSSPESVAKAVWNATESRLGRVESIATNLRQVSPGEVTLIGIAIELEGVIRR